MCTVLTQQSDAPCAMQGRELVASCDSDSVLNVIYTGPRKFMQLIDGSLVLCCVTHRPLNARSLGVFQVLLQLVCPPWGYMVLTCSKQVPHTCHHHMSLSACQSTVCTPASCL